MATRVAINGFGRIGRLVARAILEKGDGRLELVAINDLADAESNALLFKRDSVHGAYPGEVRADGNDLIIDGKRVKVTAEKDPARLPHRDNAVDQLGRCPRRDAQTGDNRHPSRKKISNAHRVLTAATASLLIRMAAFALKPST